MHTHPRPAALAPPHALTAGVLAFVVSAGSAQPGAHRVGDPTNQATRWVGGDGLWSNPNNWSMGNVPNGATDSPMLAGETGYRVVLDGSFSMGDLNISNPLVQLDIPGGIAPVLYGNLHNNGTININPAGTNSSTLILFENTSLITGTGTIRLHAIDDPSDAQIGWYWSSLLPLTNGPRHTIAGSGQISSVFINKGTVLADGPAGSEIQIRYQYGKPFIQSGNGVLDARTGVIVLQSSADIQGGTLRSSPGTHIAVQGDLRLGDATNEATLELDEQWRQTITVDGDLTNNATIVLHSNERWTTWPKLTAEGEASIKGSGEIILGDGTFPNTLTVEPDSTLTQGKNHTIRGWGTIRVGENSTFINEGTIRTGENGLLNLSGSFMGNGQFIAQDGTQILFEPFDSESNQLEGLNIITQGDGLVSIRAGVGISNFTNNGNLGVYGFDRPSFIGGTITNHGTIEFKGDTQTTEDAVFSGDGRVVIDRGGLLEAAPDQQITNAPGHTFDLQDGELSGPLTNQSLIFGWGTLNGPVTNNATIRAQGYMDFPDYTLHILGDHTQGNGIYDAGDHILRLSACSIANKEFRSNPDGVVMFFRTDFTSVTNEGLLRSYSQQESTMSGSFTNNGTLLITGNDSQSLRFMNSMTIQGVGTVELRGTGLQAPPQLIADAQSMITMPREQTLVGHGRLIDKFTVQGILDPARSSSFSFAPSITVNDLTLTSTATVALDLLDAFGQAEQLRVIDNGTITLGGTLDVRLAQGVVPNIGQWTLVDGQDGTQIVGDFDQVNLPQAPSDRRYRLRRTDNELILVLTCPSDFTADLIFDIDDVWAFIDAFESQDREADLNNDGAISFYDIAIFLSDFASPCQ